MGKEKIHYAAVSVENLENQMQQFLDFYNNSTLHPYIKSAITHLWFVIIHPFEDGNGRLARVLADSILPKPANNYTKFYSLSLIINKERAKYYEILEQTTNLIYNSNLEINNLINWHLDILEKSFKNSIDIIETIILKTQFWDNFRNLKLNNKQIQFIKKVFLIIINKI